MKNSISIITYISISIAVILWGFSFIWTNSLLLQDLPVFTLVFFRIFLAAIILLTVSVTARKLEKVYRKDWGWFFLLASFEPFIYFIGETFGLKTVNSPILSSVIISTIPIFSLIAGRMFFNEKVTGYKILGIALTIPGILLIVFEKGGIDFTHIVGIALLFVAVFSAVGYAVVVKRLAGKYNSYTIVSYQNIIGTLYFLPCFLLCDSETFSIDTILNITILKPLLFLSVLCSSVAFILFVNSVKDIGITRSNVFTSLVPAISAFGAYIIGQEGMSYWKIIGVIIVVAGVILAQREKESQKRHLRV